MQKSSYLKLLSISVLAVSTLTGCMSSTSMGYGAERKQLLLTSPTHAVNKAERNSLKIQEVSEKANLTFDEKRLMGIMNRLIPYADTYVDDGRKINWDLHLYSNKKSNIGAMANGTISLTYSFAKNDAFKSDDAMAYILAHEMSHVIRQHHREGDGLKYVVKPLLFGTILMTGGATSATAAVLHDGYGFHYRKLEKEADLLGLEIMSKAGFNPENAVNVFADFEPTFKRERPILSRIPSVISSHPSNKARTKHTKAHLEAVIPLYQASMNEAPLTSNNLIKPIADASKVVPTGKFNAEYFRKLKEEYQQKEAEKLNEIAKSTEATQANI